MTIVRPSPSSKIQKRSSFHIKKKPNPIKIVDVFSNSQLPGFKCEDDSEIESDYNSEREALHSDTRTDRIKYKEAQEPK